MKKGLLINGQWVMKEETIAIQSPYTKETIAELSKGTATDVQQAIHAAQEAVPAMQQLTARQRATYLMQLVDILKEKAEEGATIIATESAKPLQYARGEMARTIETYEFAAEEAKRQTGELIPMDASASGDGRFAYTLREPIGIVGAITPFNFPQNLVAHKVGPALATGNVVLLKPATQTALSALFLAECLLETDFPKAAVQVITGSGKEIGDAFVEAEELAMITFTGSPKVGMSLKERAGLKKVTLELGSNSGLLIDENVDIDALMPRLLMGAFSNQGQVCISVQRLYVHESIMDDLMPKLIDEVEQLKVGNPLDEDTDVSALITPDDTERVLNWIAEAEEKGATVLTGGEVKEGVLMPTILDHPLPNTKIMCEEVFGPVLSVHSISSIDEGIAAINDSQFGLQAGIFTKDIATAFRASKLLEVGGVMINDVPTYRVDQMPYGGVKHSGTGREGVKYAMEEMTEMKLVVWNQTIE